MKIFLMLVLLLIGMTFPMKSLSQEISDTSVITLPTREFNTMLVNIKILLESDSLNILLIQQLKSELNVANLIIQNDSILYGFQRRSVEILDEQVDLQSKRIEQLTKSPWYNNPKFWFISGIITTYIASEIVKNVSLNGM